ncbi:hypothetical protein EGK75_00285 [Neisseria weixii]|uniref:Uncharacterized protein n=1 Tax=Neisseria weixii TaxID=1853276 RepID=A0A3N4N9G0_9NEIS|nr:hypothetical protein EGK74_00280 [Neisseria weixii]RPD91021.1 hypothetical protein EGK75_00285 [Neisseria weixii]
MQEIWLEAQETMRSEMAIMVLGVLWQIAAAKHGLLLEIAVSVNFIRAVVLAIHIIILVQEMALMFGMENLVNR